jgi:hypothetical protein
MFHYLRRNGLDFFNATSYDCVLRIRLLSTLPRVLWGSFFCVRLLHATV